MVVYFSRLVLFSAPFQFVSQAMIHVILSTSHLKSPSEHVANYTPQTLLAVHCSNSYSPFQFLLITFILHNNSQSSFHRTTPFSPPKEGKMSLFFLSLDIETLSVAIPLWSILPYPAANLMNYFSKPTYLIVRMYPRSMRANLQNVSCNSELEIFAQCSLWSVPITQKLSQLSS